MGKLAGLNIPSGTTLDSLLSTMDDIDRPLPNVAGFDRLDDASIDDLRWLCVWIDKHSTCESILKHHGPNGLDRVLKGIAAACAKKRVHMSPRVASIAGFYEMEVF